ncbi:hypothetical protein M9H77_11352 [Catharanthus roseus]|uniref:Uncharacterized protein n=1 Tax=Catharanthus roseus TaxID=4058 RepID=A0ACC0BEI1_CATRO|nr:hypothetical protein M9H77_11352 [Catharanthus roseus]
MCVVIPSTAELLTVLPLWHYIFGYRVYRIYRVQRSLELSFFRVIVIIRFRLTRNGIISVRSINLIVIVIDGTVQHRRFIRNHRCYRCYYVPAKLLYFCYVELEYFVARYVQIQQDYEFFPSLGGVE